MAGFWSARGFTCLTIGVNIAKFVFDLAYGHDSRQLLSMDLDTSIGATIVSIFTHVNARHVLRNMVSLFFTSVPVFIDPPPKWNSPWAFLCIYIPSGLVGFVGNSLVMQVMQADWPGRQNSLELARDTLGNWVADVVNGDDYALPARDRYKIWRHATANLIGASGAVYGMVGARMYTGLFSPYHAPLNMDDLRIVLSLLGEELPRAPLSLDWVVSESFLDHSAQLFGFITGMVTACLWDKCWFGRRQEIIETNSSGGREFDSIGDDTAKVKED